MQQSKRLHSWRSSLRIGCSPQIQVDPMACYQGKVNANVSAIWIKCRSAASALSNLQSQSATGATHLLSVCSMSILSTPPSAAAAAAPLAALPSSSSIAAGSLRALCAASCLHGPDNAVSVKTIHLCQSHTINASSHSLQQKNP